ncbi:MAG: PA-phosphatase [Geobacteraceae bacterium GWC2_58_44]|nr:MAG: PA-phosphatase [Geobacteraceae bacterium GWC2_58_44]HBG06497.1 PAP2 family protein [Geobacter sp.]
MVSKVTAAVIILSATLFSIPVYAETIEPAPPQAAAGDQATPAKLDLLPADHVAKPDDVDVENFNLKYLTGYLVDTGRIIAAPVRWESSDWLKLGLVLGGTGALFFIDDEVKDFAQDNQHSVGRGIASFGNTIGEPLNAVPALTAFYLYGYLADDSKARRVSLLAMESFAISGVAMSTIKTLAKRHRPKTGHRSVEWDGPEWNSDNFSFGSGHTSSAFSLATVFADEYKDNPYVPPVAYGLATLVGLSRIYSNEHWASDAFFGAALGYFTSKAILSFHKEDKSKSANRLSIMPEVGSQMTGLTVKYDF